jgi:hypothetical protein
MYCLELIRIFLADDPEIFDHDPVAEIEHLFRAGTPCRPGAGTPLTSSAGLGSASSSLAQQLQHLGVEGVVALGVRTVDEDAVDVFVGDDLRATLRPPASEIRASRRRRPSRPPRWERARPGRSRRTPRNCECCRARPRRRAPCTPDSRFFIARALR